MQNSMLIFIEKIFYEKVWMALQMVFWKDYAQNE